MEPSLLQFIVNFDRSLFQKINGDWSNSVFDLILPGLTDLNKQKWLPIAAVAILLVWIFKQRYRAAMWIVTLIVAVGVTDLVSYRVVKSVVQRDRPELTGIPVVLRTTHHSGTSFPSNHAANAFAGASILSAAFPVGTPFFFLTAAMIAYSRVYVGVHFPVDVLAGIILGWSIAFMTKIFLGPWIIKAELSEENRFERGYNSEAKARRKKLLRRDGKSELEKK
jgi:undecaprenyl-diphosphatase